MSLRIWYINRDVLVQQEGDLVDISIQGRGVKEVEALVVSEERVGSALKQEIDNVVMALLRSPQDRCSNRVSSLCVHIGTILDEEMTKCVVVVDRGPLDPHH